jgi:hypothetical protein
LQILQTMGTRSDGQRKHPNTATNRKLEKIGQIHDAAILEKYDYFFVRVKIVIPATAGLIQA